MAIGYLVPVVLLACCTTTSLVPARRPPGLGRLSFRLSVLVNEQPFAMLAVLTALSVIAVVDGDGATPAAASGSRWPP
ncbi:hypothetical protein NKG05_19210 [Oerskovia sp. M15]